MTSEHLEVVPLSDRSDESDESDGRAKHGHQALPSTCAYLRGTSAEILFCGTFIGRVGVSFLFL